MRSPAVGCLSVVVTVLLLGSVHAYTSEAWLVSLGRGGAADAAAARNRATVVLAAPPAAEEQLGAALRSDFALLDQTVWEGKSLVYLDSAATSQKPAKVVGAMTHHLEHDNANVHRGAHLLSARSTESYEAARDKVGRFVGARDRREIIFTRGATEAINLVAMTWGAGLKEGDEIVLSVMEHHSNLVPWQLLAQTRGLVIKFARLDADECLDLEHLASLISDRTKLVSVAHVSNTLGCVNPVREIADLAHAVGAKVLIDACQSVPHMPVDVSELGYELLDAMPPWQGGGEMIDTVTLEGVTFACPPGKFEAGTPAITQAIGLGAACDYLSAIGMERVESYEHELGAYLHAKLSTIDGIRIYGPDPTVAGNRPRAALCAFNIDGLHAADLATFLDQEGIAIRAGHHCTQPLHNQLGAAGSARASLYVYNTREEVDALIAAIRETVKLFAMMDG